MKVILLYVISSLFFLSFAVQDIPALLKEADQLEKGLNEKAAFEKLKVVLQFQPDNIQALNKCSELCSRIGKRQQLTTVRDDYYATAKSYAAKALKINPGNSESNCVMAIALGRESLTRSGKEKINNAREIKTYVDAAIKNDPGNYKAWHVLGRWNYEISNLNMFERAAVKIFFGGLPQSSIEESIFAFEKSQSLKDGFLLNYFEMARAYKLNGQDKKAVATIKTMLLLPNQTEDDMSIKQDGRKLLLDWR